MTSVKGTERHPGDRVPPAHTGVPAGVCVLRRVGCAQLCVNPRTVACQASLSVGFSRQEDWSGLPCPPPGDLPDPGIEPLSLTGPALAGGLFTTGATWVRKQQRGVKVGPEKALSLTLFSEHV